MYLFKGLTPKSGPGRREDGGGLVEEGEREPRCREGSADGVGGAHQAPYWSFHHRSVMLCLGWAILSLGRGCVDLL